MKKLSMTLYLVIRDMPIEELQVLMEYVSDASSAVILMNLEAEVSYLLLSRLSPKKQERVFQCLIDLENAEERLLQQVLAKIEKEILKVFATRYATIDIKERLAELVCRFGSSRRVALLGAVQKKKKVFYNKLKKKIDEYKKTNEIYFFEDILSIDDLELRDRIQAVDSRTIAVALKTEDESITSKIMENLPKRIQEMVSDDLKYIETVSPEEVDAAQYEVMRALTRKKKMESYF